MAEATSIKVNSKKHIGSERKKSFFKVGCIKFQKIFATRLDLKYSEATNKAMTVGFNLKTNERADIKLNGV